MTGRELRPLPGLSGPHVQTLLARTFRARIEARYRRIRIDTDDGDFLDLDIREPAGTPSAACLVLHGLEGCARSGYVVGLAEALVRRGAAVVALNFRSCGGEPNRTLGTYHSGRTDDIERALAWIGRRWPAVPRVAAGFSLGGNALLNLLGRRPSGSGIARAAAVSVPYDLAACARALERGAGRLYARYFLASLREKVREKATRFPDRVSDRAIGAATMREFDDAFTAPVHGFANARDYYERCSARRWLDAVRVPTLLVQSRDDPLVPSFSIPDATLRSNPNLRPLLTPMGGHVGFLDRGDRPGRPGWLEDRLVSFLLVRAGGSHDSGAAPRLSPDGHAGLSREDRRAVESGPR